MTRGINSAEGKWRSIKESGKIIEEWRINAKTNKKKFTKAHQQRCMPIEINVSSSKSWRKKKTLQKCREWG